MSFCYSETTSIVFEVDVPGVEKQEHQNLGNFLQITSRTDKSLDQDLRQVIPAPPPESIPVEACKKDNNAPFSSPVFLAQIVHIDAADVDGSTDKPDHLTNCGTHSNVGAVAAVAAEAAESTTVERTERTSQSAPPNHHQETFDFTCASANMSPQPHGRAPISAFEQARQIVKAEIRSSQVSSLDFKKLYVSHGFAVDVVINVLSGEVVATGQYVLMREYLWIEALAVKREFQKMGFGKMLMNRISDVAAACKKDILLYVPNESSRSYFDRLGFSASTRFKTRKRDHGRNGAGFMMRQISRDDMPPARPISNASSSAANNSRSVEKPATLSKAIRRPDGRTPRRFPGSSQRPPNSTDAAHALPEQAQQKKLDAGLRRRFQDYKKLHYLCAGSEERREKKVRNYLLYGQMKRKQIVDARRWTDFSSKQDAVQKEHDQPRRVENNKSSPEATAPPLQATSNQPSSRLTWTFLSGPTTASQGTSSNLSLRTTATCLPSITIAPEATPTKSTVAVTSHATNRAHKNAPYKCYPSPVSPTGILNKRTGWPQLMVSHLDGNMPILPKMTSFAATPRKSDISSKIGFAATTPCTPNSVPFRVVNGSTPGVQTTVPNAHSSVLHMDGSFGAPVAWSPHTFTSGISSFGSRNPFAVEQERSEIPVPSAIAAAVQQQGDIQGPTFTKRVQDYRRMHGLCSANDRREKKVRKFIFESHVKRNQQMNLNRGFWICGLGNGSKANLGNALNITEGYDRRLNQDTDQESPQPSPTPFLVQKLMDDGTLDSECKKLEVVSIRGPEAIEQSSFLASKLQEADTLMQSVFLERGIGANLEDVAEGSYTADIVMDAESTEVLGVAKYIFMRDYMWVDEIAVKPGCQKMGIGSSLLRRLKDVAYAREKDILLYALTPVIPFYERNGLTQCDHWVVGERTFGGEYYTWKRC
ncbi:hypothetical protein HK102_013624 [Quaeritorhiza haematococci]|nr:hypothetical protein HK102_013624 [Quaeritorhiza haematococci]